MSEHMERIRAEYEALRQNRTCRGCQKPLPKHQGPGQPRLTCVACEDEKRLQRMLIPARTCERCGASFTPQRNNGRRFCSERCQKLSEPSQQRAR
ncbi:hypothetical protein MAE02_57680 [Microvirga aerophila]|uniref:Uncharacterized protein n=1 Tax=Microvirga aerophila TaxID=670291 RepID=A0A512C1H8_9HYPH|nr:hypothetical protein MAE02_57680 [Microvirga aerophila]